MLNFFPQRIKFKSIISTATAYGVIWDGTYYNPTTKKTHTCVIKIIVMNTGIHYDKDKNIYCDGNKNIVPHNTLMTYFGKTRRTYSDQLNHHVFKHKRPMSKSTFEHEVTSLSKLADLNIAPKVYGYGYSNTQTCPIHYGIIVMEKADCSLKDIYLKRNLKTDEDSIIETLIDTLHKTHKMTHGDMKPSNIGVYLDETGEIIKCCFFDCQKVKDIFSYKSIDEFDEQTKRDKSVYSNHAIINAKNRQV
jgi:hypothetical protein